MLIKTVCILNALLTADWKARIFPNGAHLAHGALPAEIDTCKAAVPRGRTSCPQPTDIAVRSYFAYLWDPHAKGFFESLFARIKACLEALITVAWELLHAVYGIFRSGLKYEGTKLFLRITLS